MTGDILDTIDGVVREWESSPDAMHWRAPGDRAGMEPASVRDSGSRPGIPCVWDGMSPMDVYLDVMAFRDSLMQ